MKQTYEQFPLYSHRQFSICDAVIDKIVCLENRVQFHFSQGFYLIRDGQTIQAKYGRIEFQDCDADEFNCHIIKRKPTSKGAELYGSPISLQELGCLLAEGDIAFEIYLELYDFQYLYWRGAILPYKEQGLSDQINIELSGSFPVSYIWE